MTLDLTSQGQADESGSSDSRINTLYLYSSEAEEIPQQFWLLDEASFICQGTWAQLAGAKVKKVFRYSSIPCKIVELFFLSSVGTNLTKTMLLALLATLAK